MSPCSPAPDRAPRRRAHALAGPALVLWACLVAPGAAPARADEFPTLAGYASATSAAAGETLGVHVSTTYPRLTLRVYRFPERTLVLEAHGLPGASYAVPESAFARGCGWPTLCTFTVQPQWKSGMYAVELDPTGTDPSLDSYVPFVVRGSPAAPNPVLFLCAVNTYQAYNAFGGHSLYEFNSEGGVRASRVSFDRPYDSHQGLGQPHFEMPFARWLEQTGFSADYATDVDLALDPDLLRGRRLLLVVGHNEYWTRGERTAVESFVDTSGNLGYFGGNACYYQARYEDAGRTLVCYKSYADPMLWSHPESTTVRWRDPGVGMPECALFGVMYPYCEDRADDSLRFAQPYAWITEGVEGEVGRRFGTHDVGYEFDTVFPGFSPPSLVRLFVTPVPSATCPQTQMSTYYERSPAFGWPLAGGGVFAAGTVQWSWGLDPMSTGEPPDPRLQRVTANLVRGLSQPLVMTAPGTAAIRVVFDPATPPPESLLTVQAAQFGQDETAYDPVPLRDDGAWPDSAANDGIFTAALPLPAGRRLPLALTFRAGTAGLRTRAARDELWPADLRRAGDACVRFVDTVFVDPILVAAPANPAGGRASPGLSVTPNPFRSSLRFAWEGGDAVTRLDVLDVRGRRIVALEAPRGASALAWDGRDRSGRPLAPGVYWARAHLRSGVRSLRVVKLP